MNKDIIIQQLQAELKEKDIIFHQLQDEQQFPLEVF